MKGDFIPSAQADLDTWEVNFKEKVTRITQELRIADEDVTTVINKLDRHRGDYAALVAKNAEARAATSTNSQSEEDARTAYRQLANRIKNAKAYTEAMGNELRIIGVESTFNKAIAKPLLVLSHEGGHVVIKFIKDKTDGVHIYSRRGGEKEFSFLAVDTSSPYTDNRPNLVPGQTEMREYKAWHFLDDAIIGQESDVASIAI